MTGILGQGLIDMLRRITLRMTPDELKRRGHRQVQVLGLDRLAQVVAEAVRRTLDERSAGEQVLDRSTLAEATRQEFLRLVKNQEELEGSRAFLLREKQRLEGELRRLREEFATHRKSGEARLRDAELVAAAQQDAEDLALRQAVTDLFARWTAAHGEVPAGLAHQVEDLVVRRLGSTREEQTRSRRAEHERDMDLLERRIQKLMRSLEEKDDQIRKLATSKQGDPGVASIYRTVQGLAEGVGTRKKEMMAAIFKANLELKDKRR